MHKTYRTVWHLMPTLESDTPDSVASLYLIKQEQRERSRPRQFWRLGLFHIDWAAVPKLVDEPALPFHTQSVTHITKLLIRLITF